MTSARRRGGGIRLVTALAVVAGVAGPLIGAGGGVAKGEPAAGTAATKPVSTSQPAPAASLRPIRLAVFDVDVLKDVDVQGGAVTDQVNTMLATLPKVTLVNRDQIARVAEEHQIALSGLVDTGSAVKLGKLLSAQYIVAGRASKIGHTHYLVLKIVEVETTIQMTISSKASVEDGFEAVLERLEDPLRRQIAALQAAIADPGDAELAKLRGRAWRLQGKVFLVEVSEQHVNRPLKDPAAQMAIAQRLRSLGIAVIVPKEPVVGWRTDLLQTGKYGDERVDYLLEGEGVSGFAARLQGLVSCRARVELRLIRVPGRSIQISERGIGAAADLVEALAAKTALEEAGAQASDAVIRTLVGEAEK
ncbi:MAG: hypothetical protein JXQ73_14685 [Phycisphaerae bacterium]|nr:hypothetical protein [Phycisphaerae bacterium]